MQKAAKTVINDYQGKFPETYEEIKKLSGIGEYTAGAISSICWNLPEPAVDGNVLRVLARLEEDFRNILENSVKADFTAQLKKIYDSANAGILTQAFMELGATVCLPNGVPKCEVCPLKKYLYGLSKSKCEMFFPSERKNKNAEQNTRLYLFCNTKKKLLSGNALQRAC